MIVEELDIKVFLNLLIGIYQTKIHGKENELKLKDQDDIVISPSSQSILNLSLGKQSRLLDNLHSLPDLHHSNNAQRVAANQQRTAIVFDIPILAIVREDLGEK